MTLGRGSAASFYQDHSRDHVSTVWGSCEHSVWGHVSTVWGHVSTVCGRGVGGGSCDHSRGSYLKVFNKSLHFLVVFVVEERLNRFQVL